MNDNVPNLNTNPTGAYGVTGRIKAFNSRPASVVLGQRPEPGYHYQGEALRTFSKNRSKKGSQAVYRQEDFHQPTGRHHKPTRTGFLSYGLPDLLATQEAWSNDLHSLPSSLRGLWGLFSENHYILFPQKGI